MRLTPRQWAILNRMKKRNIDRDGPEAGREMVEALWHTGLFTSVEQGQVVCKQLVAKGLAQPLGVNASNGRCYASINTHYQEQSDV